METWFPRIIPKAKYKGYAGKICIVGGSPRYTGAPFYAAMSALRSGSDLAHIFCHSEASQPLKSYSPELIVHGCLDSRQIFEKEAKQWFSRFSAFVVGPGLGRELVGTEEEELPENIEFFTSILKNIPKTTPLIIDADGLWYLSKLKPEQVPEFPKTTILTPNAVEVGRLQASQLETSNLFVFQKGELDVLHFRGKETELSTEPMHEVPRRCGGQGDILSGILATFINWSNMYDGEDDDKFTYTGVGEDGAEVELDFEERKVVHACRATSETMQALQHLTYYGSPISGKGYGQQPDNSVLAFGRGMLATDMIQNIPRVLFN